jgi:hypothetical protein
MLKLTVMDKRKAGVPSVSTKLKLCITHCSNCPEKVLSWIIISRLVYILYFAFAFRAVSSVGSEHHVDNVRVAGSSPAQPTE